jgi:hypothetical protein
MGTVLFFFFRGFSAAGGGGASVVGTVFRSAVIRAACLLLALIAPAWGQDKLTFANHVLPLLGWPFSPPSRETSMGIDVPSLALLSAAKSLGVDFRQTMMVGRQNFTGGGVSPALRSLFATHHINADADKHLADHYFCDELIKLLGAVDVCSLDNSDYQQATHIHDLNEPIPEELRSRFWCVYDGGTIEHVFNCPQAWKNCLEMVAPSGHFLQVNIANNFMGHGFWQFSPELIFRVLSPENGFRIITVLIHEVVPGGRWFVVRDPEAVKSRVELCNRHPTYILTIANRISDGPVLSKMPQQSDYVPVWDGTKTLAVEQHDAPRPSRGWRRFVPASLKQAVKAMLESTPKPVEFNELHYRQVSESDVMAGRKLQP